MCNQEIERTFYERVSSFQEKNWFKILENIKLLNDVK